MRRPSQNNATLAEATALAINVTSECLSVSVPARKRPCMMAEGYDESQAALPARLLVRQNQRGHKVTGMEFLEERGGGRELQEEKHI